MKPDIITYNTLLSGLVALQKVELAFALLDTIVRGGLHPTAATWRILMHGAASASAHGRCYDAWRNLLRTEAKLDIEDINTAIFTLVELASALEHLRHCSCFVLVIWMI
jgi:pentatricopeptide repeat protein